MTAVLTAIGSGAAVLGLRHGDARGPKPARTSPSRPGAASPLVPAWGPERKTFPCDAKGRCVGADHVVLNSGVNNPKVGDERFFLAGRPDGLAGPVQDRLSVKPGEVVTLRMFVSNSAQVDLAGAADSVAHNVRARIAFPNRASTTPQAFGWLSADNASPSEVYDSMTLVASVPIRARLLPGSARLTNHAHPGGLALPDAIAGEGVRLGFKRLDGELGACYCESGYVTLMVKVEGV